VGRSIGFKEAFAIGVGGMIGGGIFAVLGLSLQLAGMAAPVAFFLSGLVALLTSYSYAKLTRRYPSAGGTVEFIVKAYGTGVLSGGLNVLLLFSYTVMIALYAYAFGAYAAATINESLRPLFSAFVISAFVLVNALGAYVSGRVEDALVFFKLAVLILVAGAGLSFVRRDKFSPANRPSFTSIVAGGMIIFVAYEGFELISNAAADVEDLDDLPKAFYASVLVVTAIYVLIAIVTAGTLSVEEIIRARDYALAEAARPSLGNLGFYLVIAGALASTASAINATLYGVTGISYVVAKYGALPESFERPVWRHATEGLVFVALISFFLALFAPLEIISSAGSAGFLLVFTAVNVAAYKLRDKIKAHPLIPLIASLSTSVSLLILVYRVAATYPKALIVYAAFPIAFLLERAYRRKTGRSLSEFVDLRLKRREEYIRRRKERFPKLREAIKDELPDAEVIVIGSVARGDLNSAHDVDVLIISKELPENRREFERRVKKRAGLEDAPIDFHYRRAFLNSSSMISLILITSPPEYMEYENM